MNIPSVFVLHDLDHVSKTVYMDKHILMYMITMNADSTNVNIIIDFEVSQSKLIDIVNLYYLIRIVNYPYIFALSIALM